MGKLKQKYVDATAIAFEDFTRMRTRSMIIDLNGWRIEFEQNITSVWPYVKANIKYYATRELRD